MVHVARNHAPELSLISLQLFSDATKDGVGIRRFTQSCGFKAYASADGCDGSSPSLTNCFFKVVVDGVACEFVVTV